MEYWCKNVKIRLKIIGEFSKIDNSPSFYAAFSIFSSQDTLFCFALRWDWLKRCVCIICLLRKQTLNSFVGWNMIEYVLLYQQVKVDAVEINSHLVEIIIIFIFCSIGVVFADRRRLLSPESQNNTHNSYRHYY